MLRSLFFPAVEDQAASAKAGLQQLERVLIGLVLVFTLVRLWVAASTPLAFDEALYWSYSKHLAPGYLDHPYLNPLLIRMGCTLFGDTPLGVRAFSVLLGLPASWAVWAATNSLFADRRLAAAASLLFNLTIVMSVGPMAATSDQVVVATSALVLLCLAKVHETERGVWWLAVGAAFGLGMSAKYITLFFALGIFIWLVAAPERRRWLVSPWPWLGGLTALVVFAPVLLWNAEHSWASIVYQSGRLSAHRFTLKYVVELIGAFIGLATPPIFILGVLGLGVRAQSDSRTQSARFLIAALIAPVLVYFFWHALHERVQGNWIEPIFPAFSIAAAYGARELVRHGALVGGLARWSWRLATPFGLTAACLIYLALATPMFPLGSHDPRVRMLGIGWDGVGRQLQAVVARTGAGLILTTDYTLTGWARFYLPSKTPVVQINQRLRWINEPAPEAALLAGSALYLCRGNCPQLSELTARYRSVTQVATLTRESDGRILSRYPVYQLSGPFAPVLDSSTFIPRAGAK